MGVSKFVEFKFLQFAVRRVLRVVFCFVLLYVYEYSGCGAQGRNVFRRAAFSKEWQLPL